MNDNNKNITVFLIDDDDFLLEMYAMKFKTAGFKIEAVKSTKEALAKLKSGFKPDVVLLDIVMPSMDGFDFLEAVKEKNLLNEAKVIVLSNLGQKEDIEKGKALGACDYIIKASFTPSEVVKKVKEILKIHEGL